MVKVIPSGWRCFSIALRRMWYRFEYVGERTSGIYDWTKPEERSWQMKVDVNCDGAPPERVEPL